jgi:anthranilate phosphoribosyltransferase
MSQHFYMLGKIQSGQDLTISESACCLAEILQHQWTTDETVLFLEKLREKGESASEIAGFSQTLRTHMSVVPNISNAMDLCGTGGGPTHRYNVSTASAFLLAHMGIGIAKHGNRGSRHPNGSFDFIEALGIPLITDGKQLQFLFKTFNLCFLYARAHHPTIANVAEARKRVGGRSIFNLIGPLCNPAGATQQVLGVSDSRLGDTLASATQKLGQSRVLVVSGEDGYDEITPFGETKLWDMKQQSKTIQKHVFTTPRKFRCSPEALQMENMSQTVQETKLAFEGKDTAISHYIALNAGAGLYCAGAVKSIEDGASLAKQTLQSEKLMTFLTVYRQKATELTCPS